MSDLELRPYRHEEIEELLRLVRAGLGPSSAPRTADFWHWKHKRNPFGESPNLVAVCSDGLAGLRIFLKWRWMRGGQSIPALRAVDTVTHPRWRGRGIFNRLTRSLLDRMTAEDGAFVFNTPNRKSAAGYRKMGWDRVGRVRLLVHLKRPIAQRVRLGSRGSRRRPTGLDLLPEIAELLRWEELGPLLRVCDRRWGDRLHTARTRGFLTWRYSEIPGFLYRALFRGDSEASVALILRARRRYFLREILLSEILVQGDPERCGSIFSDLLTEISSLTDPDYLVASAPAASLEQSLLERCRFFTAPIGPTLMIRDLRNRPLSGDLTSMDSWYLSVGDLEIF